MGLSSKEIEVAYVGHLDYPGGPVLFILQDTSFFIAGGAVCFVLLQWAVDGLLLWRCFAFFPVSPACKGWIKAIIILVIISNIGLSCVFTVCVSSPRSMGSPAVVTAIILTYGFYTMLLNIGITGAIVVKILQYRRFIRQALGEGHGAEYIGIISILIESASIIVVYDLFFLIPAVIGHPLANIGRQIGTMVQLIPPLMIIERVARGTAISGPVVQSLDNRISTQLSRLRFAVTQSGESEVDGVKSFHTSRPTAPSCVAV